MTEQEKYMFAADIVFALLSIWFWFPQCKWPLWARLFFVAFVFGINAWFSYHDNNVMWMFERGYWHYYRWPCRIVAFSAVFSWLATKRGQALIKASEEFDRKYQWLLWGIAIVIGGIAIAIIISAFPDFVDFFSH
jgi:hypothetical protein